MTMRLHIYLTEVARIAFEKYGDDYYGALNVAECIVSDTEKDPEIWATEIHAILEGEL